MNDIGMMYKMLYKAYDIGTIASDKTVFHAIFNRIL